MDIAPPRAKREGLGPVLDGAIAISRSTFLHGLAPCPECGLHLDASRDVDELIRDVSESLPRGARVTHRRCGASFEVVFA